MADLWVGESRDFTTLGAAVSAASDGDTIYIDAGVYENDFVNIRKEVSLIGVGGMAHFTATEQIGNGKAIIIANASLTIENLEFSGASVADGNGAGIRYHNGTLVVRDSSFHDNENGILAGTPGDGRIEIHNSSFVGNGIGDGKTHGIYAGDISTFIVRDSYFEATYKGSHIKSRADTTEITGNRLIDGDGQSNYGIDISNAGDATITGNWFEQAADTSNRTMINYGSEGDKPGVLTVVGNTMINFRPLATGVKNRVDNDAVVEDNTFVDVSLWIDGQATASGNVDAELADVLANLAPLGGDDTASTAAGAAVDLAVLDNDSDGDGGTLTLAAIGAAGNGDVADNGDGTLTYTPDAGFVGDDSFDYWVVDQQGGVDRATVTVTVSVAEPPAGPAPVLFDAAGFSSYSSGQDAVGGQTILDGGTTVQFVGNTWRKFAYDYAITDDTVLAFEFRSTIEGEIHGIDLDSDNVWGRETFQVYGTQTNNWQGNPDLYTGAGNWQSFEIDAGDLFGLGD
ncbi:MAG: cadherin-like domain-containing protein, partial [Alphaproteobacteria bacterium]